MDRGGQHHVGGELLFFKRLSLFFGALVLGAGVLAGGAPAASAWSSGGFRVVRPGQSVQSAIDAVGDGGTVVLRPGTYNEHLVITHTVKLIGWGAVLAPPASDGPASPCSAPDPNDNGICVAGQFTFNGDGVAIPTNF